MCGPGTSATPAPAFASSPSTRPASSRGATRTRWLPRCARLGIEHAVALDTELELWSLYGNEGWPARYLFDGERAPVHYHYGEGAYAETELAIQELLGLEGKQAPIRSRRCARPTTRTR